MNWAWLDDGIVVGALFLAGVILGYVVGYFLWGSWRT